MCRERIARGDRVDAKQVRDVRPVQVAIEGSDPKAHRGQRERQVDGHRRFELLRSSGALDGLPPPAGQPSIRYRDVLVARLEEAGFTGVEEREEAAELWYATPEDWWA